MKYKKNEVKTITNKDLLVAANEIGLLVACVYHKISEEKKLMLYRHLKDLNVMLETLYLELKENDK